MAFPVNPSNGQVYKDMAFNSATNSWKKRKPASIRVFRTTSYPSAAGNIQFDVVAEADQLNLINPGTPTAAVTGLLAGHKYWISAAVGVVYVSTSYGYLVLCVKDVTNNKVIGAFEALSTDNNDSVRYSTSFTGVYTPPTNCDVALVYADSKNMDKIYGDLSNNVTLFSVMEAI